jgi:hypothetical protein
MTSYIHDDWFMQHAVLSGGEADPAPVDAGPARDRRLHGQKILPSERNENDWPAGDYVNQCVECKETFLGQKRSCACRKCVEKKGQEHFTQHDTPPAEDAAVSYLANGGLFNPELMDHEKVRDMVRAMRDQIAALRVEVESANQAAIRQEDAKVRLNAQVELLLSKDGRNYCLKVEKERDEARAELAKCKEALSGAQENAAIWKARAESIAGQLADMTEKAYEARAELAAIKGRKVTLPKLATQIADHIGISANQAAWNRAIEQCADAIRAAGIEVAG